MTRLDISEAEDQHLLRGAVRDFVADRSPRKRARTGEVSRDLWREMGRLGWLGLLIPEAHGGSALGAPFAAVVAEELGRNLVPEPYLATVWLAGSLLEDAQRLAAVASGERIVAVAWQERGARFDPLEVVTEAFPATGGGYALEGEKVQVSAAGAADEIIVSARREGELGLFIVQKGSRGLTVEPQRLLDGRDTAIVRLDNVSAERINDGAALLRALDLATVGLCAEMLGGMSAAFDMTLDYLKSRVQFGVPIGSFQALQHRASRMYVDLELCRSAVTAAAADPSSARAVSVAKAKCSDAYLHIALEAVQMHGGIGMTDEHDVGLYLKRARVAEMTFGDAAHHRDRFARLAGW